MVRSLIRPLVLEPYLESLLDSAMTPYPDSAPDLMTFQEHESVCDEPEAGRVRHFKSEVISRVARVFTPDLPPARAVTSSKPKASAIPLERALVRATPRAKARTFGRSMKS